MEKMMSDPVGVFVVFLGILLGAFLSDLVAYFRVGSVVRLRNRMAKILIRKYNKGVMLSSQEQMLLNFFHEKGIIKQIYKERLNPKHCEFVLSEEVVRK